MHEDFPGLGLHFHGLALARRLAVQDGVFPQTLGEVRAVEPDQEINAEITDNRKWQFVTRGTSPTGYPTRWHRHGNRIYINPTLSASYTTRTLMVGFAREATLSGSTDTFIMDPLWHPAVIDYAVHLGAIDLGWYEEAQAALTACDRKLEETVTILGRENASDLNPVGRVANDPTS